MEAFFRATFTKDFKSLEGKVKEQVREFCLEVVPAARDLGELGEYNVKPMRGFKDHYRVRLGDYRIGFKKEGNTVIFMRVMDRKDIYRHFP